MTDETMQNANVEATQPQEPAVESESLQEESQPIEQSNEAEQPQASEPRGGYEELAMRARDMQPQVTYQEPYFNNQQVYQEQYQQPYVAPALQDYAALQEVRALKQELAFKEAEQAHPELNRNSPEYDRSFDDIVYKQWKLDPSQSFKAIADEVKSWRDSYLKKSTAEVREQTVQNIAVKKQASAPVMNKSEVSSKPSEAELAYREFQKTGRAEDLKRYYALKNKQ